MQQVSYDKDDIRKIQIHNFRKFISEILNPLP